MRGSLVSLALLAAPVSAQTSPNVGITGDGSGAHASLAETGVAAHGDAELPAAEHPGADTHAKTGPGYDFVELGWSALNASHNGSGPAANLSVSLSKHAFVYANASFVDLKHGAGNADAVRIGIGFHAPVSAQWDVLVRGAAQYLSEGGHNSLGVQFEGGLKGKFTPQLEAWAMIGQSNWSDEHYHDQTFARLGLLYEINHHWGITGDAVVGKHEKEYFLGISYLF